MDIKIKPSALKGIIISPPSKSYAHRNIIAATLANKECTIKNCGNSSDVVATINCLKAFGADIDLIDGNAIIKGFKKQTNAIADCNESGSTLRFLMPIAAALGIKTKFTGDEKLFLRPTEKLIDALNKNGANISDFTVNGQLFGGTILIDGSVSSQYVSGLIMALPLLKKGSKIKVVGRQASLPYIEITKDVMQKFGITVKKKNDIYFIDGDNKYDSPSLIETEGDFSGAAFAFSAGALGEGVTVSGLNINTKQGDIKILDFLNEFGAQVEKKDDEITVKKKNLVGTTIDCSDTPDLAQIIAVVAAFCKGTTIIKGVERLKYKESDRLSAIIKMLTAAGIKAETDGEKIVIFGGNPHGSVFDSEFDHRTAMSCAILASFAKGESVIRNAHSVNKSYTAFYDDLIKIGGKIDGDI